MGKFVAYVLISLKRYMCTCYYLIFMYVLSFGGRGAKSGPHDAF